MKLRSVFAAIMIGTLLIFASAGVCQDETGEECVESIGYGLINWTAGYIEAMNIGAPPPELAGRINARPVALRAAKEKALGDLMEIVKDIQVDSTRKIKDFMMERQDINAQILDFVQRDAMVSDQQYLPDGTAEIKLRVPIYGNLTRIILPASITEVEDVKLPAVVSPSDTSASPPAAHKTAPRIPPTSLMHSGIIVDARGMGAKPAMAPKIFDENGKEVYGYSSVDREYAVRQGTVVYTRDIVSARTNQRVAANPLTIKAVKTDATGKTDLVIGNIDAQRIRGTIQETILLKQCRVIIVLD
ncbi:MAG: hypothetical protein KBB93_01130 [Syntrophaceae bacterium]|nr:hypothetical protein [Syntrophaceae bacterium]